MDPSLLGLVAGFVGTAPPPPARPRSPVPRREQEKKPIVPKTVPKVRVVVFSKDRAMQLGSFLESVEAHFTGAILDVAVLWTASSQHAEASYARLIGSSTARFIREVDLASQLRAELEGAEFVLFAVDDAIAYDTVDLALAAATLQDHDDVLSFQLRLSPHISWSHSSGRASVPPTLEIRGDPRTVFWRRSEAICEWDYGWDLCCALYRGGDAMEVADAIGKDCGHPNTFEAAGARLLKTTRLAAAKRGSSACFTWPCVSVLAVNRVQTVHNAAIYETTSELLTSDQKLDREYYASRRFDSVHIGDVAFSSLERSIAMPLVSFLIPVLNGELTVIRALESALSQCSVAEVIVVDDGSTDRTVELVQQLQKKDDRIRLLLNEKNTKGVGRALNRGLEVATSPLIARLDADDECLPRRLERQLRQLFNAPKLAVLGGCAVTRWSDNDRAPRYVQHPCDEARLAWGLLFSCEVTHPTVLMRRGPTYSETAGYAEDYDLWLRLTEKNPWSMANLSEPLVTLGKSSGSASSVNREAQSRSALEACFASLQRRGVSTDILTLKALREPAAASRDQLAAAAELLSKLEESTLRGLSVNNTSSATLREAPARARETIRDDATRRIAELALLALRQGADASTHAACQLWARRGGDKVNQEDPTKAILRLLTMSLAK